VGWDAVISSCFDWNSCWDKKSLLTGLWIWGKPPLTDSMITFSEIEELTYSINVDIATFYLDLLSAYSLGFLIVRHYYQIVWLTEHYL